MITKIITLHDLNSPSATKALQEAACLLNKGQLVAFPTETVYGLGANAKNAVACQGIFAAKGRPADNPLIVHIADMSMLYELTEPTPLALQLIRAFWPGPLTLVLSRRPTLPPIVSAGLPTVAIRWPAHKLAQALITAAACPIAAPSANLSGRVSPTLASHVYEDLKGKIPLILDNGPVEIGLESTVVDVCHKIPLILRPGHIDEADIQAACGLKALYPEKESITRPPSPGMKYRHYAPQGELHLANSLSEINRLRGHLKEKFGVEPLLITTSQMAVLLPSDAIVLVIANNYDLPSYAHNLFAALRQADEARFPALVVESVPEHGLGAAIMNRLRKAAANTED